MHEVDIIGESHVNQNLQAIYINMERENEREEKHLIT